MQWLPGLFPRGTATRTWRCPPTPPSAEANEIIQLYLYSPSGPSWPVLGRTLPLSLSKHGLSFSLPRPHTSQITHNLTTVGVMPPESEIITCMAARICNLEFSNTKQDATLSGNEEISASCSNDPSSMQTTAVLKFQMVVMRQTPSHSQTNNLRP